jgi:hypothetical protein
MIALDIYSTLAMSDKPEGKNDMNTDIDDSDCIVIQKGGGEVGKPGVESVGS